MFRQLIGGWNYRLRKAVYVSVPKLLYAAHRQHLMSTAPLLYRQCGASGFYSGPPWGRLARQH